MNNINIIKESWQTNLQLTREQETNFIYFNHNSNKQIEIVKNAINLFIFENQTPLNANYSNTLAKQLNQMTIADSYALSLIKDAIELYSTNKFRGHIEIYEAFDRIYQNKFISK